MTIQQIRQKVKSMNEDLERLSIALEQAGDDDNYDKRAFFQSAATVSLTNSAVILLQTEAICAMLEDIRKELQDGKETTNDETS